MCMIGHVAKDRWCSGLGGVQRQSANNIQCTIIGVKEYIWLLSPRNALRRGYSNAAVVPSVRASVSLCVTPCPCERDSDYTFVQIFIKLGRHVNYDKRMNPIDFGGQRSKVKVTIDIFGNKLVNAIETKPVCATSSNLADMLAIVRGRTLLILEVRGQRSRSQLTYMEISLWTR